MKSLFITLVMLTALASTAALLNAQTDETTAAAGPPLSQPLVREGDFALKLSDALKLGIAASETEAESVLSATGVAPRNGWIADYPVTPDIVGELQSAVSEAADSGKLAMGKDEALKAFQGVITDYDLIVNADTSGQDTGDTSGTDYPDSTVVNNYYYDEGPPVVTYYAPPPDYTYLYTWVPYPFWWWDFWFPGFFVLVDFDVRVHGHERGHERGHGDLVSNHFRDPGTGQMARIDPAHRSRGGTFPASGGARWTGPSAQSGARAIVNSGRASTGRGRTGAYKEFRGYGVTRPSAGTRSSVFERSVNRGVEKSASDRGFQSRSKAGQISPKASGGGGGVSRGGGGFHGGDRR